MIFCGLTLRVLLPPSDPGSPLPAIKPLVPSLPLTLRRKLAGVVGEDHLITDPDRLLVYESDGLTQYRYSPSAVILPGDADEVAEAIRILHLEGRAFVARGAGTGLSGGALATRGAVVVGTARLNRILEVDPVNRRARVEPGVINSALTAATRPHGLIYAPDPSSQSACTLGGNVAENSGGPHCLKYGVTSRYVEALTVILPDGRRIRLEGPGRGGGGPDWVGLMVGSEGCFGIVTEIEVGLIPEPAGVRTLLGIFDSLEAAGHAVTSIISSGLLPAALEIVDHETIRAVEASVFAAGYPTDAAAALVVELDGVEEGLDEELERAAGCVREAGATELRIAATDEERTALWAGRKRAFGAMGRIAPDLLVQDATVPRSRLPEVLRRVGEIGQRHGLTIANVFHAGDGNLHPNLLFDRNDADELARVEEASREIMDVCIEVGGTITGEHGVGIDKRGYMARVLSPEVLHAMAGVRAALDPSGLCNPGKVLPEELPEREDLPTDPLPPTGGEPVQVESAAHASALMAAATRSEIPVSIDGRARRRGVDGPVLELSTTGLRGVIDHSPPDLTVTVGAGTPMGDLQSAVSDAGQWFPLDPPGGSDTTIGAALDGALDGPLRAGYGRLRDHLLGATLVTGEGRVLALGGRVVKNVAGFDLLRLAVGARGSLGLVTQVTLRLFPIPACDRTLIWQGSPGETVRMGGRLAATGVPVAALEWLAGPTGAAVAARLHGNRGAVDAMAATLEATGGSPLQRLDDVESRSWWEARASREGTARLAGRVATSASRAEEIVESVLPWLESGGRAALHLIGGGLRIDLDPEAETERLRALERLAALTSPGVTPRDPALERVVAVFDPARILVGNRSRP